MYRTATSLDGFIADPDHSLAWLFVADAGEGQAASHQAFLDGVGVLVKGASTYEWLLRETGMLARPAQWADFYGERPTFVFTHRQLPVPAGADVRFARGPVAERLPEISAAAAGRDVWIVGGGDLAGQFLDAGALDEVFASIAPVTLGSGAPLLPRRLESARLRLVSAESAAQFVHARYAVSRAGAGPRTAP